MSFHNTVLVFRDATRVLSTLRSFFNDDANLIVPLMEALRPIGDNGSQFLVIPFSVPAWRRLPPEANSRLPTAIHYIASVVIHYNECNFSHSVEKQVDEYPTLWDSLKGVEPFEGHLSRFSTTYDVSNFEQFDIMRWRVAQARNLPYWAVTEDEVTQHKIAKDTEAYVNLMNAYGLSIDMEKMAQFMEQFKKDESNEI